MELSTLNVRHNNLCISNEEMQITTRTFKKKKISLYIIISKTLHFILFYFIFHDESTFFVPTQIL